MAKSKAIAVKQPVQMEAWEQELANEAKADAAKEVLGVPRITHKSGVIMVDGKKQEIEVDLPNGKTTMVNGVDVAVIDYTCSHSFYKGAYQEGKTAVPVCYSFSPEPKGARPHPSSPEPQHSDCDSCPHNAYGTALVNGQPGGKGKRCKEERKLMVIRGTGEVGGVQKAEVRSINVPPGSLKAWSAYLSGLSDVTPLGVRGVVTRIGTEPLKGSYGLTFQAMDKLGKEFVQAMMSRRDSVKSLMVAPYPAITEEEEVAPAPKKGGKKAKYE